MNRSKFHWVKIPKSLMATFFEVVHFNKYCKSNQERVGFAIESCIELHQHGSPARTESQEKKCSTP